MRFSPRARTLFSLLFNAAATTTPTLSWGTQSTLFLWVKYRDARAQAASRVFSFTTIYTDNSPIRKGQRSCGWVARESVSMEGKYEFHSPKDRGYGSSGEISAHHWPQQSLSPRPVLCRRRSMLKVTWEKSQGPAQERRRSEKGGRDS